MTATTTEAAPTAPPDPTAWHAWRSFGIGASDAAKAYSGRYGGRYAVIADKLGHLPDTPTSDRMTRGHRWEQPIADAVLALTGLFVVGEQLQLEHPDAPHRRCTLDGLLAPTPAASFYDVVAVLEIKTHGRGTPRAWDYWIPQVQYQLHVTALDRALLAAAEIDDATDELVGLTFRWIDRDVDMIDVLARLADDLWAHVENGTLPEPDVPGALDAVKAVHATADPDADTVALDDLAADVERLHAIRDAVKAVTDERELLEARIRARLGAATKGRCAGWRVSLSKPSLVLTADGEARLLAQRPDLGRVVLDRDRAKTDAADLYDAARDPAGARRLTISKEKP